MKINGNYFIKKKGMKLNREIKFKLRLGKVMLFTVAEIIQGLRLANYDGEHRRS